MRLKLETRKELFREASKRYQKAKKKEKTKILDELVQTLGCNRKYLLHVLSNYGRKTMVHLEGKTVVLKASPNKRRKGGGRHPIYTGDFTVVLSKVWAFFWYRCGKILAPFIREQVQFLEEPFRITPEVRKLLVSVSPATIDRVLRPAKKRLALKGKSRTKPGSLLKRQIPVRTYYTDEDKKPGFFETDTVHHCGTSEMGEYNLTLVSTDVFSGWVELRPTLNKASKWVYEGMEDIRTSLPFPFLGMDSDNGQEFMNKPLLQWCIKHGIRFTRSRPYRKNDNCYVEQKNHPCVRNIVGYYRFENAAERDALARVYRSLCPLLNYFMPTQKLLSKTRVGSKIKKVYDKNVLSPYQRLIASPDLADEYKVELTKRYAMFNPVKLQQEVHDAVASLIALNKAKNLDGTEALAIQALQAV
jgi:hypothetical protein